MKQTKPRPTLEEANKMVKWDFAGNVAKFYDIRRELMSAIMVILADDWSICYNDCNTCIDHETKKTYLLTEAGLVEAPHVTFGEYDEYEEGTKCSLCP